MTWVATDLWNPAAPWGEHSGAAQLPPVQFDVGAEVWQTLGPALTEPDQGVGRALVEAMMRPLVPVERVVRDVGASPGWSRELDPDRTGRPRWAAQFTGDTPPADLSDAQVRRRLVERPHQSRGHPSALVAAAQPLLRGSQSVQVFERDGSAYRVRVRTYSEETPDAAAVNAALQEAKPGGLLLTLEVVPMTSYAAQEAETAQTYASFESEPAESYAAQEV